MGSEIEEINKVINFRNELGALINKYSKDNESNTPDFILARFIEGCLTAYTQTVFAREKWFDKKLVEWNNPKKGDSVWNPERPFQRK